MRLPYLLEIALAAARADFARWSSENDVDGWSSGALSEIEPDALLMLRHDALHAVTYPCVTKYLLPIF
jgi:hypothetical protein